MSGPQGHGVMHSHEDHAIMRVRDGNYVAGPANSSMAAIAQLFARLSQEIEEQKPPNCIHFIVNFLCKHYPEHLHGFASIWNMDPDLERERHEVVNFFKSHKISTAVAAHFTNAGYDTLDTLTTLSADQLVDVEAFNNVKWLPGHKVRLQQIFAEIPARVRAYRQAHPKSTRDVVGHDVGSPRVSPRPRPVSPQNIRPVRAALTDSVAYTSNGPREYVVNVSQPVRVGGHQAMALTNMPHAAGASPMAAVNIDVNGDGRPNYRVTGVDMNRDGIPDYLQQPGMAMMPGGVPRAGPGHPPPYPGNAYAPGPHAQPHHAQPAHGQPAHGYRHH